MEKVHTFLAKNVRKRGFQLCISFEEILLGFENFSKYSPPSLIFLLKYIFKISNGGFKGRDYKVVKSIRNILKSSYFLFELLKPENRIVVSSATYFISSPCFAAVTGSCRFYVLVCLRLVNLCFWPSPLFTATKAN